VVETAAVTSGSDNYSVSLKRNNQYDHDPIMKQRQSLNYELRTSDK